MALNTTKVWTQALTTALAVEASDNATLISLIVASGTCDIVGTRAFKGINSNAITLQAGQNVVIPSHGQNDPIELTITPTGTTNVMILF